MGTAGKVFTGAPAAWKAFPRPAGKPAEGSRHWLAGMIDHTLLKPDAVESEIKGLCREAVSYGFAAVCVNPCWARLASQSLKGTSVKVCAVVGFPFGSHVTGIKAAEAAEAVRDGADELDMVIALGPLKSGKPREVLEDVRAVREACAGKVLKVILETSLLTLAQKVEGCVIAREAGADFVKTSTGFAGGGATVEDVRILREAAGPKIGIKASGGIRTYEFARSLIQAGATRLGTSASVEILTAGTAS